MGELNLDAIRARADRTLSWISRDPCNIDGFRTLSAREHFDHDVPALLAEVERLRVDLERARADADELLWRERNNAGHGRDGHLNEDDLMPLIGDLGGESDG